MKKYLIGIIVLVLIAGGVYYLSLNKVGDSNLEDQSEEIVKDKIILDDNINTPLLSSQTLRIHCSNECNISGLNSWRSDFYVTDNSGKKIKVLIDIETRLRFVMDIDSETPGKVEKLQKWEDFYPLFNGPTPGGSMPTSATIYGDYVGDSNTFKANWIKWSVG